MAPARLGLLIRIYFSYVNVIGCSFHCSLSPNPPILTPCSVTPCSVLLAHCSLLTAHLISLPFAARFASPHPAFLDPSFESMVRCQLRFAEEGYSKLSGVQRYFSETVRDDYANGQLDQQVESALAEMKDLAIYGV